MNLDCQTPAIPPPVKTSAGEPGIRDVLLLVDSDPSVLHFIEDHVRADLNGQILTASNALQALNLARDNPVRVAVIALDLNDEKAYNIIPQMKRIRPRMNVIVTTSDYSEQAERKSRLCGLSLYLPKPLDAGIIREAVTTAWASRPNELRPSFLTESLSPRPAPTSPTDEVQPPGPSFQFAGFHEEEVIPEKEEPEDLQCPKCSAPYRAPTESCAKCGLVFSLWKGRVTTPEDDMGFSGPDQKAFALWTQVIEEPSHEPHHQAFVTYCYENSCLDFAARRYQELVRKDPYAEHGAKYRDRIIALTLARFIPRRPKPGRTWIRRYTSLKVFLVLILLALSWGFAVIHLLLSRSLTH